MIPNKVNPAINIPFENLNLSQVIRIFVSDTIMLHIALVNDLILTKEYVFSFGRT